MKGIGAGVSEFLHGDCIKLLGELQTRGEMLLIDGAHSYAGAKRDFEVLLGADVGASGARRGVLT